MKKIAISFLVIAGLLVLFFSATVLFSGQNPFYIMFRLYKGTLGNFYGIAQILFKATPIILTALACAFSFRAGLFNVGMEGQGYFGAFAMALVGIYVKLPGYLLLPLCLAAGFVAGGLWGALAGWLKARYSVHEVISTIMLNFIAVAFINFLLTKFNVPETVHTAEVQGSLFMPRFDGFIKAFKGSPLNMSLVLAVVLCLIVYFILSKTKYGFSMKIMERNITTAKTYGVDIKKRIVSVMFLSGGIAGLIGINFILGYKHYFEEGFIGSAGFIGIAASLIAFNSPVLLIVSSLFLGFLSHGSLVVNAHIPKEIMDMLQAVSIMLVVAVPRMIAKRQERKKEI